MAAVNIKGSYIAELIGTFTLVFCGTGAIVINEVSGGAVSHAGIAITFGFVVMALIYAFGDISGTHINPAVTIAFTIAGKFPKNEVLPYIIFQSIGGILASLVLTYLFPENELLGGTYPAGSAEQSFILEFLLTFFLMLIIIFVATGSKEKGIMAGLAIGGTVLIEAMFAGPICGASMNPIRSIAPALVSGHWEHQWLYVLAPITGAILSIGAWKMITINSPEPNTVSNETEKSIKEKALTTAS